MSRFELKYINKIKILIVILKECTLEFKQLIIQLYKEYERNRHG